MERSAAFSPGTLFPRGAPSGAWKPVPLCGAGGGGRGAAARRPGVAAAWGWPLAGVSEPEGGRRVDPPGGTADGGRRGSSPRRPFPFPCRCLAVRGLRRERTAPLARLGKVFFFFFFEWAVPSRWKNATQVEKKSGDTTLEISLAGRTWFQLYLNPSLQRMKPLGSILNVLQLSQVGRNFKERLGQLPHRLNLREVLLEEMREPFFFHEVTFMGVKISQHQGNSD